MNSLMPPRRSYLKPLGRDERVWMAFAIVWCLFLFVAMYAWQGAGAQKTPIESYRIETSEFRDAAQAFIADHTVDEIGGVPVVEPNADGEIYMVAKAFAWEPILKLTKGETARIYLSSYDVQHGMSIQPLNINFQALPGYVYVIELTPNETGEFPVICNEYCGLGHHAMAGRIIVTD